MTMISLFFYKQLMNLKSNPVKDPMPDTDNLFLLSEPEPSRRQHDDNDDLEWPDEDEYRE